MYYVDQGHEDKVQSGKNGSTSGQENSVLIHISLSTSIQEYVWFSKGIDKTQSLLNIFSQQRFYKNEVIVSLNLYSLRNDVNNNIV